MSGAASSPAISSQTSASDPPTLRNKYSGIPERLLDKARKAKQLVYQNQSKPISNRSCLPVVPLGISQPAFSNAIAELQDHLGDSNVVINDKPLDDGW